VTVRPGSRWPIALRAAASAAIVLVSAYFLGDMSAGLIATLGTFTCRFGTGRPYVNRGVQLAVVAVALAGSITLGAWAAPYPVLAVGTVSAVGVTAVWLCNALAVGPPGAYIFVLVCAAGVGVSAAHLPPWQIGVLVLAGGATAWVVQMLSIIGGFRRPEADAVTAAGNAVAAFVDARGTEKEVATRHDAAAALHRAWAVLVSYQPVPARPGGPLYRLRAANHALHVLFTDAIAGAPTSADTARELAALHLDPVAVAGRDVLRTPLGRPAVTDLLRRAVAPGAHTRHVMLRVAIATPIAGTLATVLGIGHPYWAIAAAVLVLHQGGDRVRTLQRGGQRLLGTWLGLGLAAVILLAHPQGLWLALILTTLQLVIELLVVRNYTLASVFITTAALTIASSTRPVDIGEILLSRGTDTLIGCAVGVLVYLVTVGFQETTRLATAIAAVLDAVADTCRQVARDDAMSLAARTARRDLQAATLALRETDDATRAGSAEQKSTADRLATPTMAAERIAYHTLSACWALEHEPTVNPFATGTDYPSTLRALATALRSSTDPPAVDDMPAFMADDVAELRAALLAARD